MRWNITVKAILCFVCAALISFLAAGEYRSGELYLEILLNSGSQLDLKAWESDRMNCTFTESAAPISRTINEGLSITLATADNGIFWGFLNRTEPWQSQSDGILREYFAWEDSSLVIRRENLVFEDISFPDNDSAKLYAKETGFPTKQIREIPLVNSTVRIKTASGQSHYFETPLRIHTDTPIQIGGVKLGFSGDFILKTIGNKLVITHNLPLEDYIAGVIQNEIGSNAPLEALKAQAVAARTHAISLLLSNKHANDGYDLCNSTHCQVYKGKHLLNDNITQAVMDTKHEVAVYAGKVAETTYHSACGGKTDSSHNIWKGQPLPYLEGVSCFAEAEAFNLSQEAQLRKWIETPLPTAGMSSWEKASVAWQKSISRQKLAANLGMSYINRITINQRGFSGRIIDMSFFGSKQVHLISEYKIRQAFGSASSSLFYIAGKYSGPSGGVVTIYPGGTITLKGRGSGHGVGMCQVGALRLARSGSSYREILAKYYPGTEISSNWIIHE